MDINSINSAILGQTAKAASGILTWAFALIAILVVMAIVVYWIKKRLSPTEEYQPGGFTLADLRELRRSGAMSEEEFERAKGKVLAALQATADRKPNAAAAGPKIPPAGL